jgi:hypothetical protein
MGSIDYHKCIACSKGWISENLATKKKAWAKVMKEKYPEPAQWHHICFSNEIHWSVWPEEKVCIIRKPGEYYCANRIQHTFDRSDKKQWNKQQHS